MSKDRNIYLKNEDGIIPEQEINRFCYVLFSQLNTTKATITLNESDIIKNCNTSMFRACNLINEQVLLLYSKKISCHFLIQEAKCIIADIKRTLLAPYGEHFSRWFEFNIKKAEKDCPDFYNDLHCIQKLEKDYPFYDDMLVTFKECQKLLFLFHEKIDGYLHSEAVAKSVEE